MAGFLEKSMRPFADKALSGDQTVVTLGYVYDGYTSDGIHELIEICDDEEDLRRYWVVKTFEKES